MSIDKTQMTPPGGDDRTQAFTPQGQATQMPGGMPTQMGLPAQALTMECVAGNKYALSTETTRDHVLVSLRSMDIAAGRRAPLNLALVVDRSGSMEGEPLEYVKRACGYVVDLLEPTDILTIVVFEEQVQVLMPARRVINKQLVKEHINRIEVGNTTNLYDGIVAGCSQVAAVRAEGYVNRVLAFSDGEPTAGIKDFSSIVGMVGEQKSRGVTVTVLGFGPEYNEELLAGIARRSGGNYYYITRPELIPEVFRKELEVLMSTVARNLRLKLNLSRWVQVRQAYGKLPTYGMRTAEVTLTDLERGSAQSALWEVQFDPRPAGVYRVAGAELTYDDSVSGRTEKIVHDVVFEFTPDRQLVEQNANPAVQREIEVAEASRNLERTVMGMRTQQIAPGAAVQELERTRMILLQQGKADQAQDVQQAIDNIKSGGAGAEKTLMGTIYDLDRGKSK
ncbi:MAG: VWA domain-containing protein [Armatimonadota bacterium]|nr:VWA domain-containing protein [Armatimonadota bacterium]